MTPQELYTLLEDNDVDFLIVEIFEGVRFLRIEVEEPNDD
jgi:hypothetical protein